MNPPRTTSSKWIFLAAILWLLAIAGGYSWIMARSFQASELGGNPVLDLKTVHMLDVEKPTLFVFLHPECPCSEATVEELARISERCEGGLKIVGVFSDYSTLPRPPAQSRMWNKVESILGARSLLDEDAGLRHSFHAATSGECFLLGPDARVIYHGGITSARGHSGPSTGGDAIISFFNTGIISTVTAPVFGCTLDND